TEDNNNDEEILRFYFLLYGSLITLDSRAKRIVPDNEILYRFILIYFSAEKLRC
ncbi:MAG: hypothetical protein ACI8SK_000947, partial [Shewanella sp.]